MQPRKSELKENHHPKEAKDSALIFHKQKSGLFNAITRRAAWGVSLLGSASIIPISLVCGGSRFLSGKFANGLATMGYGFVTGVKYSCISAASCIISPSIGAHFTKIGITDPDDLYQNSPKDGFQKLDPAKYPPDKFTITPLDIRTDKGKLDAIEISHADSREDRILIKFCGAGHNYQQIAPYLLDDVLALKCKVIIANYPGVTCRDYKIKFSGDLLNVGRAVVDNTIKRKNLTNKQAEDCIILEGYSLGGGVATNAASYFKYHFDINFPVFVNRSYWSLTKNAGGFYNIIFGLPVCYGEALQKAYYHGGGGWDINSKEAYKILEREKIDYFNVENDIVIPKGVGFSDAAGVDVSDHYFTWNGKGDPEFKTFREVIEHIAPNQTLHHSRTGVNARDHFRLFANRMWNKSEAKTETKTAVNESVKLKVS